MSEFDGATFRATMSQFCTGVVIATGAQDGVPAGFAAQSFVSLSMDPPLVALCPGKQSSSWPRIRDSGAFCINILGADQQEVCATFAKSGGDKFAELKWRAGVSGSPILAGVIAYVDCELEAEHDAGDHTIAIGRVRDLAIVDDQRGPLLFFRGRYGDFSVS
ncbi:MAG: flavin reductase family protein [Gammaproteobacteria bacterium]|nr:flavin reductase family protein [Gammaproteobacteria bacterium]